LRRKAAHEAKVREQHPHIGGFLLAMREEPQHVRAWAIGEDGEQRVARGLEKRCEGKGVLFLHDRGVPRSRANIDHIAIGPSGVVVIDAKRRKGKVTVRRSGLFGPKELWVAGRRGNALIEGMNKQLAVVRTALEGSPFDGAPVRGLLCFVDADLPLLERLAVDGIAICHPRSAAKLCAAEGPIDPPSVEALHRLLADRLPPARVT
jgi:hypothetical protein